MVTGALSNAGKTKLTFCQKFALSNTRYGR